MKFVVCLMLFALTGCSSQVEEIGSVGQELVARTLWVTASSDIQQNPNWIHSPAEWQSAWIMGDWDAVDPNATWIGAAPGTPLGQEQLWATGPNQIACNGIVSIQSVVLQLKLHTNGANEQVFFLFSPPSSNHPVYQGCGNMPPNQPLHTVVECGMPNNPETHAAWQKVDVGCGGATIYGYQFAPVAGIALEAARLKVNYTALR